MTAAAITAQQSRYTRVKNPDLIILHQIAALCGFFGKRYCYPSQIELCKRIAEHGERKMSRRTLNRHLKGLVEQGLLNRVRRHRHVQGVGLEMHSTLYVLTKKAWKWLAKLFGAVTAAVSWGRERVTHSAQYIPSRDSYTRGACTAALPQERKSPPDGGGGSKQTTHGIANGLKSLREVLTRGRC